MRRRWFTFGCVAVECWLATGTQAAPVGTAFTYQGQLKQDGAPAAGVFDFRFRLLSASLTRLQDTCTFQVDVANGLFTADVDFGAAVFDGSGLVVQVFVKAHTPLEIEDCVSNTLPDPYTALSPVQPLAPTPYSIHALSAGNGHALDAADGSPTNALSVDNAGNVGIGTLSPGAPLHVAEGTSGASVNANASLALERNGVNYLNMLAPDANEAGILFSKPTGGTATGGIVYDNTATLDGLQFRTNNNATRMVIDSLGRVGIGTTAPTASLHVADPSLGTLLVQHTSGSEFRIAAQSTIARVGTINAFPLRITTGGNDQMFIDVAGNVGIGSASPATKLHIDGGTEVSLAGGGFLTLGSMTAANLAADSNEIQARNNGAASTLLLNPAGGNISSGTAANVGIGTSSPTSRLHVVGATTLAGTLTVNAAAGDASVALPDNSISAAETLEEPGIGSDFRNNILTVLKFDDANAPTTLASRSITVPTDGFVIAFVTCVFENGIIVGGSQPSIFLEKTTAPTAATDGFSVNMPDGIERHTVSFHAVFAVSAGANTFTLRGVTFGLNTTDASTRRLTLMFVPTTYGTTDVED
jgi:hypothetical protein